MEKGSRANFDFQIIIIESKGDIKTLSITFVPYYHRVA